MGKTVLVAEDEPGIIESLHFLLSRAGYAVEIETEGAEALTAALERTPDVLVLDVMLPGMDGYEILRRLRSDSRTSGLPVIMLTAKSQREDREAALSSGADVFITKPFANADIIAAVKKLAPNNAA